MSNKRRNRRGRGRTGIMGKAFNQSKLAANVTEEADWYLDTPDVRLTRIFMVVLILHVIAVGGILAFKMIDKAAGASPMQVASKNSTMSNVVTEEKELASKSTATSETAKPAIVDPVAQPSVSPTGKVNNGDGQYKVAAGDKLPAIAKSLGVSADALRRANDIRSDNELYPGRWLDIPSADAPPVPAEPAAVAAKPSPAKPKPEAPAAAAASDSAKSYTVKSGDTAWGISRQFSVSFQELMSFNNIDKPEALQIGQVLKIPR